jgi:hypothetical protein
MSADDASHKATAISGGASARLPPPPPAVADTREEHPAGMPRPAVAERMPSWVFPSLRSNR